MEADKIPSSLTLAQFQESEKMRIACENSLNDYRNKQLWHQNHYRECEEYAKKNPNWDGR